MDFNELASRYGLPAAMLIVAVLAFYFDKVVSGTRLKIAEDRADRLEAMVFQLLDVNEESISLTEQSVASPPTLSRAQVEAVIRARKRRVLK